MKCPSLLLAASLLFPTCVVPLASLFDNGQLGAILGTSFGIPGANATFDYVVVGGGTAGLTVATRLAENKSLSIAVVEAGGFYELDNGNYSVIPGEATQFTGPSPSSFQPLIDWHFATVPQKVGFDTTDPDVMDFLCETGSAKTYSSFFLMYC